METSNGKNDGSDAAPMEGVENGSKLGGAELQPRPQDAAADDGARGMEVEVDADTQLLGPSSPDGCNDDGDGDGDGNDGAESSGSSAAEMSGGTNRSSGGYSGDYSSISDSSSDRDKEGKKQMHRKGHERALAGTVGSEDAAKKADGGEGPPDVDGRLRPRDEGQLKLDQGEMAMNGHAAGRRHSHSGHHQDPAREHIHSYHRHNHNHHHLPRGAKAQAKTEEVNRKIDEIMNLYNVSLRASAIRDAQGKPITAQNVGGAMAKRGSTSSGGVKVEASGLPHEPRLDSKAPQLNGMRIVDPLDLRIDAQQLYQTAMSDLSRNASAAQKAVGTSPQHLEAPENGTAEGQGSECYANLMEACRPFFHDGRSVLSASQRPLAKLPTPDLSIQRPPPFQPRQSNGAAGSSSSGFTSFFTTTKSESNQTQSGSGGSFSDKSSQQAVAGDAVDHQKQVSTTPDEGSEIAHAEPDDIDNEDQSDSSSMVVLARVKRKHKSIEKADAEPQTQGVPPQAATLSNTTDESKKRSSPDANATEASTKRVRIETVAVDKSRHRSSSDPTKPEDGQGAGSSLTSSLTQSLDSSGSDSGQGQKKSEEGSNVEASSNTESGSGQNQPSADTGQSTDANGKPRVVTDITSSGTTTANGSSGSGTGSSNEANTTSNKSESGSGDGNSDEKAVGERDSTGSDGAGGSADNQDAAATAKKPEAEPVKHAHAHTHTHHSKVEPLIHHHHHGGHLHEGDNRKMPPEESITETDPASMAGAEQAAADKERIVEKKRKRMHMRREYEEEVQRQMRDSSESSSIMQTALEPGKPVTLEEVLSFTKTARLLVQALPPFLAVHVNAAFTSLCGIQSSAAIGTPVASIISLPDANATANKESNSSGSDETNNKDAMSSLSGSVEDNGQEDNSNMAIANGAGMPGAAQALGAQGNNPVQNALGLRIDRLIVARGYGHIHDVEVLSVPHHSHSHAIEGSEVKFIEGNGPAKRRKRDESKILCRMSVSPVISTIPPGHQHGHHGHADGNSPHQPSGGGKRRKVRSELSSVKHYLIQLEAVDGPRLLISRSSSSSTDTTMEAQLLGITKTEVHARRCRVEGRTGLPRPQQQPQVNGSADPSQTEDSQDEGSSGMEPVATCG